MDKPSPLTSSTAPLAVLPPQQPRGANAPPVSNQDFREMLATQGIKAPAGAVPTAAEAKIEAAQIAAKANVNMGVRREPVLTGMQPQSPNVVAPTPGRFLPLRQGPSAARLYNGTVSAPTTSVETLRATTRFAPGPVATTQTAPILARTAKTPQAPEEPSVSAAPPSAVEAYTYGLRAASENKPGDVPAWFDGAVQNALDKYDALNKAQKKP